MAEYVAKYDEEPKLNDPEYISSEVSENEFRLGKIRDTYDTPRHTLSCTQERLEYYGVPSSDWCNTIFNSDWEEIDELQLEKAKFETFLSFSNSRKKIKAVEEQIDTIARHIRDTEIDVLCDDLHVYGEIARYESEIEKFKMLETLYISARAYARFKMPRYELCFDMYDDWHNYPELIKKTREAIAQNEKDANMSRDAVIGHKIIVATA